MYRTGKTDDTDQKQKDTLKKTGALRMILNGRLCLATIMVLDCSLS